MRLFILFVCLLCAVLAAPPAESWRELINQNSALPILMPADNDKLPPVNLNPGLIGNVLTIPIGILRTVQESLTGNQGQLPIISG